MSSSITSAGLPETKELAGTLLITNDKAPIIAPSPIVTPGIIVHCSVIQTLSPITQEQSKRNHYLNQIF